MLVILTSVKLIEIAVGKSCGPTHYVFHCCPLLVCIITPEELLEDSFSLNMHALNFQVSVIALTCKVH